MQYFRIYSAVLLPSSQCYGASSAILPRSGISFLVSSLGLAVQTKLLLQKIVSTELHFTISSIIVKKGTSFALNKTRKFIS